MRRFALLLSALFPLVLVACTTTESSPESTTEPVQEEHDSLINDEELVTHNVTYVGVLEEGGVTIYQQGTHRLMLSDGKMVLLEPNDGRDVGLNLYVGKLVRVKGDVMPTVEAGGTIMEVQDIAWIRRETVDGKEAEALRVLCGGEDGVNCPGGATCVLEADGTGMCSDGEAAEDEAMSAGSSSEMMDSTSSPQVDSSSSAQMEEEADGEEAVMSSSSSSAMMEDEEAMTDAPSETVQMMIDEDYADDRWTQEYCSTHLQFCVPVHKNWYFKSFGATASLLWHVEMGAKPVEDFSQGPLVVDLKSGDLTALSLKDGDVREVGMRVIGYRSWSDNRHFEISAPKELKTPVMFVTQGLRGAK